MAKMTIFLQILYQTMTIKEDLKELGSQLKKVERAKQQVKIDILVIKRLKKDLLALIMEIIERLLDLRPEEQLFQVAL